MSVFKPQLLPNNEAGVELDWDEIIKNPQEWMVSEKLDGVRVEIPHKGPVLARSLKVVPNIFIQAMADHLRNNVTIPEDHILEAEFYAPDMTFSEIIHFFKTENIASDKTTKKYKTLFKKTLGNPALGWPFPGRSYEWVVQWHSSLQFYAFDLVNTKNPNSSKESRMLHLASILREEQAKNWTGVVRFIPQHIFSHVDQIYQAFDQAVVSGKEGLVLIKKTATYKYGRHTLASNLAYKLKDDNLEFDGKILDVEEGTIAREGSEKTINELGRSVTSKLKEDRVLSGIAKGFLVEMEDGNTLTVSLKDYTHEEARELLKNKDTFIGTWIRFTGMAPVKDGGCPRHARFTKGNFRDDK